MSGLEQVIEVGESLLSQASDSVVRFRLLRDVLRKPPDSQEVIDARKDLDGHPHVHILAEGQWRDGSWGRLHSKDYDLKQTISTTEMGVERAIHLGLDKNHPVLQKASRYLVSVLVGGEIRDPQEVNDRWGTGVRLFAAATLARIDPTHPKLDDVWSVWHEIISRTFNSGEYDEDAEAQAHKSLTGASVRGSYLTLRNKYTLTLISSRPFDIPPSLEKALLSHLWRLDECIGYLNVNVSHPPVIKPGPIDRWFSSHELLSRFPTWRGRVGEMVEWLWEMRNVESWWDFGPRAPSSVFMPLSKDWRKKGVRQIDWGTRVLLLLTRYYSPLQCLDTREGFEAALKP